MNDSNKGPGSNPEFTNTGTRVDLGEDLLAEPTSFNIPVFQPAEQTQTRVPTQDDRLENARILFKEGMLEEAKKELHQIVIVDGGYLPARRLLDEIHDLELKQIFQYETPRRSRASESAWIDPRRIDTESIMSRLDDDLKLGLSAPELSLLKDSDAMQLLTSQLDQILLGADAQDRIDMGIAFLEMGLFDVSSRIFRVAARTSTGESARSATALLAYSLILSEHAFEATLVIAPVLQDGETDAQSKVEFYYLMGRAHEALRKPEQATSWYRQALEIEPRYRDSEERVIRLG